MPRDDMSYRTGKAIEILGAEVAKTRKMIHALSKKPRCVEDELDLADLRLRLRILKSELDGLKERCRSPPNKETARHI